MCEVCNNIAYHEEEADMYVDMYVYLIIFATNQEMTSNPG